MAAANMAVLARQYIKNQEVQALRPRAGLPSNPTLIDPCGQDLIPAVRPEHIGSVKGRNTLAVVQPLTQRLKTISCASQDPTAPMYSMRFRLPLQQALPSQI